MKKIINFYQRLSFTQGAIFAVCLTSIAGIAGTVTGLHTFSSGTIISSTQVNDNFNILKTAIETSGSQKYVGVYDASTAVDPTPGMAGDYYVITTAGTINGTIYNVNDWIIYDGAVWSKIPSSAVVTSVFGRTGSITSLEGDYNLDKMSDVDFTTPTPVPGNFLQFDGTMWRAGVMTYTETDPGVQNFAKSVLPICSVGQVLKSDGSSLICVTDIDTDGTTAGTISQYYRGDKTWQNLDTSVVAENVNLYFTDARVLAAPLMGFSNGPAAAITSADSIQAAFGKTQGQLDNKLSLTGGVLSVGTISGVLTPISPSDIVNKDYVDSFGQWSKNGANINFTSGGVGIGTPSPAATFHVQGTTMLSGLTTVGGDITISGTSTATAHTSTSDMRLKKNIFTIEDSLEKVLGMRGVEFDWKKNNEHEIGVIAQEIEKIVPTLVVTDALGMKSVKYSNMAGLFIESTKQMHNKVTALEEENKMLKSYLCAKDPQAPFCQ